MIPVDPTAFWPLLITFAALIIGAVVWKIFSVTERFR